MLHFLALLSFVIAFGFQIIMLIALLIIIGSLLMILVQQ